MPDEDCQNSSTFELCILVKPNVVSEVGYKGTSYNSIKNMPLLIVKKGECQSQS